LKSPRARVIVADDVRDSADTIVMLLAEEGYEARAVYDGNAVVELADKWQPRCAVLDLSLPGMSGFDCARHLRRKFGGRIRLVAYTGWSSAGERERAMEAGFDAVVVKPADALDLLRLVDESVSEE
jgi:CheY-like chemotaxis protein